MSSISQDIQKVIDHEYAQGKTAIEISKQIGIGKHRVFAYLKETGQIRKGGFKKEISSELECKVNDLYLTGLTTKEVADKVGLGQSTVVGILSKYGNSRSISDSLKKYPTEVRESAISMYLGGHSLVAVAKFHNIRHPSSIEAWLKEKGIPLRSRSDAAKQSDSHYMRGRVGEDHHLWKGGISYAPYCSKFNKAFKERVRSFFNHTCALCGKKQEDEGRRLQVHHIHYNKQSCCDEKAPKEFIVLCNSCHMRTNHNREYWENYFSEYIWSKYQGKCYYTELEYLEIQNDSQ